MTVKGNFVVNPAVTVPAEAITTDRGIVLIEHEEALTALCPIQSDSIQGKRDDHELMTRSSGSGP